MCHLSNKKRDIYTSHDFGDVQCPSLSAQDRKTFLNTAKLSIMKEESNIENNEDDELAESHGYQIIEDEHDDSDNSQVHYQHEDTKLISNIDRKEIKQCSLIQPCPSQILTVFLDNSNKNPFHIELDSGATINYIRESEARKFNFTILPNNQVSKLGDGLTKLRAVGEVKIQFFRKACNIIFHAIVCKNLTAPAIGGTKFMKDNSIEQDLVRNVIYLNNRKVTVLPTEHTSIIDTAPILHDQQVRADHSSQLLSFQSRVLLPQQEVALSTKKMEGSLVSIEPWEQNGNTSWPNPQLQEVTNGKIRLLNNTSIPIQLGKEVKKCKLRNTEEVESKPRSYYNYVPTLASITSDTGHDAEISLSNIASTTVRKKIMETHRQHRNVFDKDLTMGYNGVFGKHECRLNWATRERPPADKVRVPNYNHCLKSLQQELMDELTNQNVLLIPQEHEIQVQSVCPSFVQRKQRAKNVPEHLLTKNDIRLLINFGPVNERIKPVPIHVT